MPELQRPTSARLPRTASLLATGLATLALFACGGGDEQPPPKPEVAAEGGGAKAPAGDEAPKPSAGSGGRSGSSRNRIGLEATVTPAPEGTDPEAMATLAGIARLLGKVPERKQIAMDHIGGCREHSPAYSEAVLATEDGKLQNVVVYVTRGVDKDAVPPAGDEKPELIQDGCAFKPHVMAMRAGQTLVIKNEDKANHNVNAKPKHGSNPVFNQMQPPTAADMEVEFPQAEIAVPIACDVHPWMKAYVAVVDHPYYSISDAEGAWSIELPAGDYLVEAWHERFGTLKGTVEVAAGESAEFKFEFESGKKRR